MAHIESRKHPLDRLPRLNGTAALTALAISVPGAALAQAQAEAVLPSVNVSASAAEASYKGDYAGSSKYTEPLLDTPKSVTVITKEVLSQTNATSLQEALRTTPGITFGMGEGGNPAGDRPFIRGFDSQSNFFIDGLRDPSSQSRDMFNVEQVDVVKGPDSAYSGSGAVGGSINLTSKNARLGNFGEVTAGLGTSSYKRGTADLNRQIGDHAAFRINTMVEGSSVAGRDNVDLVHFGIAPSLAIGLGTPTRLTLGLYHYQTDDTPDYGIPYDNPASKYLKVNAGAYGSTATTAPTTGPLLNPAYSQNGNGGPLNVNRANFYGLTQRDFRRTQVDSGTLKIERDLNDHFTLSNSTRYTHSSNDYIASNPGDSKFLPSDTVLQRVAKTRNSVSDGVVNTTQLNGEFVTSGITHHVATGVEIAHNEVDSRGYLVTGTSWANIQAPNGNDPWTGTISRNPQGARITTNTLGLYAFDTLALSKRWLLNVGVRHDHFATAQEGYSTDGTTPTNPNLRSTSNFWSYQAGLVFKPAENGSVYFNYATAANPSGISSGDGADTITLTNQDLQPEKIRSFELGTKWNVLHNKLSLTAAIFNIEKSNAKVSIDPTTMATIGKQRINGIELGFAGAITSAWQIFGGYTHMNSTLMDTGPSVWTVSNGVWTYNDNAANKGNQFPNTPRDSFSLWSTYKVQPNLSVGGGAYYMSKIYGDAANTKWIPSYWRFDGVATYDFDKTFSLRLNVNNIFDKTYYNAAYANHMVSVAPGRQAMLTGIIKF